jgi:hypothetical protein
MEAADGGGEVEVVAWCCSRSRMDKEERGKKREGKKEKKRRRLG